MHPKTQSGGDWWHHVAHWTNPLIQHIGDTEFLVTNMWIVKDEGIFGLPLPFTYHAGIVLELQEKGGKSDPLIYMVLQWGKMACLHGRSDVDIEFRWAHFKKDAFDLIGGITESTYGHSSLENRTLRDVKMLVNAWLGGDRPREYNLIGSTCQNFSYWFRDEIVAKLKQPEASKPFPDISNLDIENLTIEQFYQLLISFGLGNPPATDGLGRLSIQQLRQLAARIAPNRSLNANLAGSRLITYIRNQGPVFLLVWGKLN